MLQNNKTKARVVSPCFSVSQMAVIYFLNLKKISLISSLKSVISTAITAMKKLRSSIMDSCLFGFHPHTQTNSQKKSSISHKRTELKPNKQVVKPLESIYQMDKLIIS
ncbi:hypothetical protein QDH62_001689 [Campylobacter jejuni]|nr:hypothetical protein [Campylobacter jejuni]